MSYIWENILKDILIKNMWHLRDPKKWTLHGFVLRHLMFNLIFFGFDWNRIHTLFFQFSIDDILARIKALGIEYSNEWLCVVKRLLEISRANLISYLVESNFKIYRCMWQLRSVVMNRNSGSRLSDYESHSGLHLIFITIY